MFNDISTQNIVSLIMDSEKEMTRLNRNNGSINAMDRFKANLRIATRPNKGFLVIPSIQGFNLKQTLNSNFSLKDICCNTILKTQTLVESTLHQLPKDVYPHLLKCAIFSLKIDAVKVINLIILRIRIFLFE